MFGIEGILYLDGDILHTNGIDRWWIDHLCTEVTELHRLNVWKLVDGVSCLNHLWVSGHESVYIRPNLQHLSIQYSCNDRGGVVRTATSEIRGLVGITVSGDKTRNYIDTLVVQVLEGFLNQLCGKVGINHVLAQLFLRADKVTAVHAHTVFHHRCYNVWTQSLTIANDRVLGLLRKVVNEINTVEDTLQLVEELIYIIK